jgi:hypothetical protein
LRTAVGFMLVGWPARADVDWLGLKNFLQAGESWDFLQARLVQLGGLEPPTS